MKKLFFATVLLATTINMLPVFSLAQTAKQAQINENDAKLLSELIAINTYELMLTRMATSKALSVELRQHSEMMNKDHQRMDAELTAYANRFNIANDPDKREKYVENISKWDGDKVSAEWDKDIAEELVDAHRESVRMMRNATTAVKDVALKNLIGKFLPQIQQHLDVLILMKDKIKQGNATLAANPAIDKTNAAKEIPDGNEKDAKFLSDLRLMNTYELGLLEIILKKGNHRALKDAALQMLEKHRQLGEKLSFYAKTKRYGNDPDEAAKTNEKLTKWLQKKGGMEWDADIIEELIDDHKDGIDLLEDAITDVKDEELKMIMAETLPTLKKDVNMLEPLKETVKKPWKEKQK